MYYIHLRFQREKCHFSIRIVPLFHPNYGTIHPESGNCHFSVESKQFFIPMVNYYDKNRFISKSELARLADVSPRTFTRYLATRRHILDAMGISPNAKKLPPQAVRFLCEDYCIDLPPELQDQRALSASPIRDLIVASWKEEQEYLARRNSLNSQSTRSKRVCES